MNTAQLKALAFMHGYMHKDATAGSLNTQLTKELANKMNVVENKDPVPPKRPSVPDMGTAKVDGSKQVAAVRKNKVVKV